MNKNEIIELLRNNYGQFIDYLTGLSQEDLDYHFENKWSAGEQLQHIVKSISPLTKAFGMPKAMIAENFGETDRVNSSYDELIDKYLGKLEEGGKAPSRFLPASSDPVNRKTLIKKLTNDLEALISLIGQFEEEELETLQLPHPLLGPISLKEMLYHAIYHVNHHLLQAQTYLERK
ncbi:MAG: DinB family protein [Bacteroidota bacterium]